MKPLTWSLHPPSFPLHHSIVQSSGFPPAPESTRPKSVMLTSILPAPSPIQDIEEAPISLKKLPRPISLPTISTPIPLLLLVVFSTTHTQTRREIRRIPPRLHPHSLLHHTYLQPCPVDSRAGSEYSLSHPALPIELISHLRVPLRRCDKSRWLE